MFRPADIDDLYDSAATEVTADERVAVTVELDRARHLLVLEPEVLPPDWRAQDWPASAHRIGTRWYEDRDSVVLQVPSAIVPRQHNYLINPQHPQFPELRIEGPEAFEIDPRLA